MKSRCSRPPPGGRPPPIGGPSSAHAGTTTRRERGATSGSQPTTSPPASSTGLPGIRGATIATPLDLAGGDTGGGELPEGEPAGVLVAGRFELIKMIGGGGEGDGFPGARAAA